MAITIIERKRTKVSPWVTLVERSISRRGDAPQTFHSISIHDYITILAVTPDNRVPLVRQYRPALEAFTVELPGGLLDTDEEPSQAVIRELHEETGYRVSSSKCHLLGRMEPDSGRLENHLWAFYGSDAELDPAWKAEADVETSLPTVPEFLDSIRDGRFTHGPHIAAVGLALLGRFI
jgi:ADP-ribose pyrophosphatase